MMVCLSYPVGTCRLGCRPQDAAPNKIGTYGVAVLAQAHSIPFYVAAPTSTFDPELATGAQIPIEQRPAEEITHGFGSATAPVDAKVYNPTFDVTPAKLIAGIITECGVVPPSGVRQLS